MENCKETVMVKSYRNFASISTENCEHRIWISRPNTEGRFVISCSFSMSQHMPFADAIDALPFVMVERVHTIDENLSYIHAFTDIYDHWSCMEKLIEELPSILEEHLGK